MTHRRVALDLPAAKALLPGNHEVLRALPRRERRRVGPFAFLDHAQPTGPVQAPSIIGAHPHVGLQTLSYLLDGEVDHADSIGSRQRLRPGDVNWMTAGRGILHAERVLPSSGLHLVQIWVALPPEARRIEPRFDHVPERDLPRLEGPGWHARLVAGTIGGARSPVPVLTPLTCLDLHLAPGATFEPPVDPQHELAVYVLEGAVTIEDIEVPATHLAILDDRADTLRVRSAAASRLLVLGGEPLPGSTAIWWNFITDTVAEGRALEESWKAGTFPGQGWQPDW